MACVAARCGLSRASRLPRSSRESPPISPRATPTASTPPAHRRSMRRRRNPPGLPITDAVLTAPAGASQPRCASPRAPLGLHRLPDIRSQLPAPNRVTSTTICLFPHRHRTRQRPHRYCHNNVDRRVDGLYYLFSRRFDSDGGEPAGSHSRRRRSGEFEGVWLRRFPGYIASVATGGN